MVSDLSKAAEAPVGVQIKSLKEVVRTVDALKGVCLDELDIECTEYQPQISYLKSTSEKVTEVLHTDLLKSNCLVTGQPDWGSVEISYKGRKIDQEGLVKYIVSLRDHNEFHEQCVERIFMDIMKQCSPDELSVYARYTRRGGLDINPFRTNKTGEFDLSNARLIRQ